MRKGKFLVFVSFFSFSRFSFLSIFCCLSVACLSSGVVHVVLVVFGCSELAFESFMRLARPSFSLAVAEIFVLPF